MLRRLRDRLAAAAAAAYARILGLVWPDRREDGDDTPRG